MAESCTGTSAACPGDGFKASTTTCRAANGDCDVAESCTGTSATCPGDGFKTATTICRPAVTECDVAESCTGTTATCPADVLGDCGICRTPGFWGTHPIETQTLLTASTGLLICGVPVQAYNDCAVEGLCNTPQGNKQLILARQLMSTALNCFLSGSGANCSGNQSVGLLFSECNAACAASVGDLTGCASQLDCYNNGGKWVGGMCALGSCSVSGAYCQGNYGACPIDQVCNVFAGNCHDKPLIAPLSEPPNPADPGLCNAANMSMNTMFTQGVCPQ